MPDIRIKDLTTTASSTASDDFFAADGTTNGTRKLSAYSPSFGGNATVGGTLGVTGQANFAGGTTYKWATDGDVYVRQLFSGANGTDGVKITQSGTGIGIIAAIGSGGLSFRDDANTQLMNLADSTGIVTIPGTTASTSTSSGALVVSGGVGVAGNTYVGGDLVVTSNTKGIYSQGYVTVKGQQANFLSRGTDGGWTGGMHFYSSNTDYSASIIHLPYSGDLQFYTNSTSSNYTSSDIALQITTAKQVQAKGVLIADAASNAFRITTAQTPASATATGTAGTIAWDTSYIYVCTATNTWKRVAISTW